MELVNAIGDDDHAPLSEKVDWIISQIASSGISMALVLDDFHEITEPEVIEAVQQLIEYLPYNAIIAITSRSRPRLPLGRWRARESLAEVGAEQLRLSSRETSLMFANLGDSADLGPITARVQNLTGGWPAGARAAWLLLQAKGSVRGDDLNPDALSRLEAQARDYFVQEILDREKGPVGRFLLESSILSELDADKCDFVLQRSDGAAVLAYLEQSGLFVTRIGTDPPTWIYHPLFAHALRQELGVREGSGVVRQMHVRAMNWYLQKQAVEKAIDHAIAAQEWDKSRSLVLTVAQSLAEAGAVPRLRSWLNSNPLTEQGENGELVFWRCFVHLRTGDYEGMRGLLPSLSHLWSENPDALQRSRLQGLQATLSLVDLRLDEALALSKSMLADSESLPSSELEIAQLVQITALLVSGKALPADRAARTMIPSNPSTALDLNILQAEIAVSRGDLRTAARLLEDAASSFVSHNVMMRSTLLVILADICRERMEYERVEELLSEANLLVKELGFPHPKRRLEVAWSQLDAARGDWDRASSRAREVKAIGSRNLPEPIVNWVDAWYALTSAESGNLEPARALLPTMKTEADVSTWWGVRNSLIRARLMEHLGMQANARRLLGRVRSSASRDGRSGESLRATVALAGLDARAGDLEGARLALNSIIHMAIQEGYGQVFLDQGSNIVELLGELRRSAAGTALQRRIRERETQRPLGPAEVNISDFPGESLTEREQQVLRIVAQGATNQEIAASLGIAIPTVKRHLSNIFLKLSVGNRTQAIIEAHKRGYD